ncbi:MAG: 3-hydroxyacyl-ACP dehydratase FabZ [Gammaproteobacteria bacterium]
MININEILEYIPHRYPFLLIDRVLEVEIGKRLVAIKNVSANEPFFAGHFPGKPVMPGVLILEALAQASAVLACITRGTRLNDNPNALYLFAGVDKTRFRRIVEPGDQLRLEVELLREKRDIWKLQATALVDGEVACSAELTSAKREVK